MMTEKVETPHFPPISAPTTPRPACDLSNQPNALSFRQGTARHAHDYLGAHAEGDLVVFRLWAPQAMQVSVVGPQEDWSSGVPMTPAEPDGVWQAALPAHRVPDGSLYKYRILCRNGETTLIPDPYGRAMEPPPGDASVWIREAPFVWHDDGWMRSRAARAAEGRSYPLSIYEVRFGAWKPHRDVVPLSYHELADELTPYVKQMGYTHVLLFSLTEPTDTGRYAPSARYGTPDEFRLLVDILHGAGVGVLAEWSPPAVDVTLGEARSHLLSNLHYWVEEFHLDGLRLPPQAGDGDSFSVWQEAMELLLCEHPDVLMITPEASPVGSSDGGEATPRAASPLPCLYGWAKATLAYALEDPLFRKHKHAALLANSRPASDAFGILPMAHDTVGHPHRSFLDHMNGDYWQKFAGARLFAAWMMTHPGGKLWSMGCEIGQFTSKDQAKSMEWYLLDFDAHARLQRYFADLHQIYRAHPALWDIDPTHPDGAMCRLVNNVEESILAYRRVSKDGREVIVALNFTPVVRESYRLPVSAAGSYREIFNSDDLAYGGSDVLNPQPLTAIPDADTGVPTLILRLPPLGCSLWEATEGEISERSRA